jgi:hypothetical protein
MSSVVIVLSGGKIGLFGGAGVGKTVFIMELINNIASARHSSVQSNAIPVVVAIRCRSDEPDKRRRFRGELKGGPARCCPLIHVADWFVTVRQAAQLPSTRLERVQHANRSDRARHFGS